jgi:hypothetical protein
MIKIKKYIFGAGFWQWGKTIFAVLKPFALLLTGDQRLPFPEV